VAGINNKLTAPIFLLPLNPANQLCVTATTGGGTLTMPEAPGFSLTFGPGQVTFPGGSKTGCVSVTVVHGDKVPMVPGFGQQQRLPCLMSMVCDRERSPRCTRLITTLDHS